MSAGMVFTVPLSVPSGSATYPSISFNNERTLGFYRAGSGVIGMAGKFQPTGVSLFPDGTNVAPSISCVSEPGLGFYRGAAGHLVVANANGLNSVMFVFGPTGFSMGSGTAISWASTASAPIGALGDTILIRDAANTLAQKNGVNAQEFRIYGTTTGPKYLTIKHSGAYGYLTTNDTGNLVLGINNITSYWYFEGATGHLKTGTDNAFDIGAVGAARPRNLYVAGNLYGNGSTLTGITGATGGVSNTGSTTIASDSDNSGAEDIAFYTSTVARWFIKGGTGHFLPNVNDTYEIGSTSQRVKKVWATDLLLGGVGSAGAF
jgi:hypothetical protein